eukprot:2102411-Rhodomonas_salina.1
MWSEPCVRTQSASPRSESPNERCYSPTPDARLRDLEVWETGQVQMECAVSWDMGRCKRSGGTGKVDCEESRGNFEGGWQVEWGGAPEENKEYYSFCSAASL